jgi:hypothetical protein
VRDPAAQVVVSRWLFAKPRFFRGPALQESQWLTKRGCLTMWTFGGASIYGIPPGQSADDRVESLICLKNTAFLGRFDHEVSVCAPQVPANLTAFFRAGGDLGFGSGIEKTRPS